MASLTRRRSSERGSFVFVIVTPCLSKPSRIGVLAFRSPSDMSRSAASSEVTISALRPSNGPFRRVGQRLTRAHAEIAEMLARLPPGRVAAEEPVEGREDFRFPDVFADHLVEPLAMEAAANIEVVLAGRPAGQRDLGDIGPRTAVRAAGHPERDRLVRQPVPGEKRLELVDEARQIALAFGHGEAAGREGDAGHRIAAQRARALPRQKAVLAQELLDAGPG